MQCPVHAPMANDNTASMVEVASERLAVSGVWLWHWPSAEKQPQNAFWGEAKDTGKALPCPRNILQLNFRGRGPPERGSGRRGFPILLGHGRPAHLANPLFSPLDLAQ